MKKLLPITLALLILLTACGTKAAKVEPSPTPEVSIEPSEVPSPSPSASDDRGIQGSHYTNVTLGLKDYGIPKGEFASSSDQDFSAHNCASSNVDSASQDNYDYLLYIDKDLEVISASFGITYGGIESSTAFSQAAIDYLGYCSTMPYNAADTVSAKAFVTKNIPSVADLGVDGQAGEISETYGDATFTLYGVKANGLYTTFWLEITKAK